MNPTLNLVVLRCADIDRAMAFYSKLGLHFARHRHGTGAEHYSAELAGARRCRLSEQHSGWIPLFRGRMVCECCNAQLRKKILIRWHLWMCECRRAGTVWRHWSISGNVALTCRL